MCLLGLGGLQKRKSILEMSYPVTEIGVSGSVDTYLSGLVSPHVTDFRM